MAKNLYGGSSNDSVYDLEETSRRNCKKPRSYTRPNSKQYWRLTLNEQTDVIKGKIILYKCGKAKQMLVLKTTQKITNTMY